MPVAIAAGPVHRHFPAVRNARSTDVTKRKRCLAKLRTVHTCFYVVAPIYPVMISMQEGIFNAAEMADRKIIIAVEIADYIACRKFKPGAARDAAEDVLL